MRGMNEHGEIGELPDDMIGDVMALFAAMIHQSGGSVRLPMSVIDEVGEFGDSTGIIFKVERTGDDWAVVIELATQEEAQQQVAQQIPGQMVIEDA